MIDNCHCHHCQVFTSPVLHLFNIKKMALKLVPKFYSFQFRFFRHTLLLISLGLLSPPQQATCRHKTFLFLTISSFDNSTLVSLDQTYHLLDNTLTQWPTKIRDDINQLQPSESTTSYNILTYIGFTLSIVIIFAFFLFCRFCRPHQPHQLLQFPTITLLFLLLPYVQGKLQHSWSHSTSVCVSRGVTMHFLFLLKIKDLETLKEVIFTLPPLSSLFTFLNYLGMNFNRKPTDWKWEVWYDKIGWKLYSVRNENQIMLTSNIGSSPVPTVRWKKVPNSVRQPQFYPLLYRDHFTAFLLTV